VLDRGTELSDVFAKPQDQVKEIVPVLHEDKPTGSV
jgi:hypothetical protein